MPTIQSYFDELTALLQVTPKEPVERLADLLEEAWKQDRRVLLMGNGGSAATASHIVNDLQKCLMLECGKALKSISLSDCSPLVLAWANDTEYANVYAPQITCWVEPGDLVIAISGSGNSPNIIRAVEEANRLGANTFGLAGYSGGKLATAAKECLVVPSDNMQRIEDVHMAVLHAVFTKVREQNRVE
jgi:D-sedoheptulose 7-phosphate isomerase